MIYGWIIIAIIVMFIIWRVATNRYRIRRRMLELETKYRILGKSALTEDELRYIGK